jgi:hypothetical protein
VAVTRVFVHVGAPKTGTTYLQQRLFKNREALAADGVLYPYELFGDSFRSTLDFCGTGWAGGPPGQFRGSWDAVARRVRSWEGPVAIVSNELLGHAAPARIKRGLRTLGSAEVHVLFTARDIARQLVSDWQEHIKHKHTVPLEKFVDDLVELGIDAPAPFGHMFWGLHDPLRVLAAWGDFVPPERVHLITVPQPGGSQDTLWERFCAATGLEPTRYADPRARTNTSMGVVETELLRRLNTGLKRMRQDDYDPLVRRLMAEQILGSRSSKLTLPPDKLDWALEWSKAMVAEVESRGYDVVGDLSDLMPRAESHAEHVSPSGLSDAELAPAAMRATTGLLRHAAKQRHRIVRLRQQLEGDDRPAFSYQPPPRSLARRVVDRGRGLLERIRRR